MSKNAKRANALYKAIVTAKNAGADDYEIAQVFLIAMLDLWGVDVRMRLTYPRKKKSK